MSNTALGAALTIDDSVLAKIKEAENKIIRLEQTTRTSSDKIAKSFRSAGDVGIQYFIDKLKLAQTELGKINIPNIDFGKNVNFGQVSHQATMLAESITKASVAINQYYSSTQKSNRRTTISTEEERKAYIQKYEMYKRMFDQIDRNERKAIKAAENEAKAQERAAQRIIAAEKRKYAEQVKIYQQQSLKQNTTYQGALSFSESATSINQRTKAIQYLTQARAQLSTTDANYTQKLKALNDAIKRMNAENEKAVQGSRNLAQQHSNLMNTSDQLARKLALIFSVSQIQGYVNRLIQVRGEFELQNTALASILQNKDKADRLFSQITELAVKSPFSVKELTTYTKSLSAYSVEYDKLYDTTKMLADVSAGLGVDMQRLILAFGQVKAANFLRGTETRQFTEAGINMLGELAKYYSELEGRIVSVGEVQDRQFKKMISFGDVEKVFKRLTSAGGMFYQMQERQAETLAGQISNLTDTMDIMFNEIGKANDGLLKGMVGFFREVLESWETISNVLKATSVGFVVYASKVALAALANKSFAASSIAATASQKGLVGALGKTIKMFGEFASFVKANPFVLIASGVAFLGYELQSHLEKVKRNKEAYDSLINTVETAKNEAKSLVDRIQEQNKSLLESNEKVKSLKKGTSEYAEAEANANREREKQASNLEELKNKFPEIYNGIVKQKDGTVDLTTALEDYNKSLEGTNYLNYLSRQTESFFSDGLLQNISDATEAQSQYSSITNKMNLEWKDLNARLKEYYATNDYIAPSLKKQLDDIANSSLSVADKIKRMYDVVTLSSGINIGGLRDIFSVFIDDARKASKATIELKGANQELAGNIDEVAKKFVATYNVATEEGKKQAQAELQNFLRILDIKDESVRKFVQQRFEIKIGVKLDLEQNITPVLGIMEKRVNEYLKKNKFYLVPEIKEGSSISSFFTSLQDKYSQLKKESEEIKQATQNLYPDKTNIERLKEINSEMSQVKQTLKDWGKLQEKVNSSKGVDSRLKTLKDQISFLQRVNSEYKKLLKNYSEEEARKKVISSMQQEASQLGISDIMIRAQFDDRGILSALNMLKSKFNDISPEMSQALAKAIGSIQIGLDVEVRENRVKEIQNQFSNLFGNYELSLELDKLGLDKDIISKLFNIDIFSLDDLRKNAERYKYELQNTLGKDGVSAWDKINKQISDAEAKELQDRLKTYSKYLKKSVSERVAIEMEAQKKIAEVRATSEFTPEQQESIVTKIKQETQVKKDEQSWKEFQNSELYIKMFEDLEFASTKALDVMEEKLSQLRGSLKSLSPTELKQINDQLEKIREVKISRNPFNGLIKNIKEYRKYLGESKELNDKFIESQSKEDSLSKLYDNQLKIRNEMEAQYAASVKVNGEGSKESLLLKEKLTQQDKILDVTLKQLVAQGKITQKIADQIREGEQLGKSLSSRFQEIGRYANELSSGITDISSSLENVFGTMDDKTSDIVSSFAEIASGVGNTATGIGRILSGDIFGGGIQALSGLASTIGAIFNIGDKKKEREIQRQIEQVEKLQKAYEKLEEAIDSAYSIDTLKGSTDKAIANLQEQNQSLQNAIAAEESKKKTDDDRVKEWQDAIESNNEAIEQRVKDQISKVTAGILDDGLSAADAFVDAWLEAFQETGDGLKGLEDNFNEMLLNMIKRQAAMNLVSPLIEKMQKELEKYINKDDTELTISEAEKYAQYIKNQLPEVSAALENLFNGLKDVGLEFGESGDTMSGLSKSISGITADQADALAAITESIRFFSADSNAKLTSILAALTAPAPENPFLLELKAQTEQLRTMNSLWNSLSKTSTGNGKVLKVQIV